MRMTDLRRGWPVVGNDGGRVGRWKMWARTTSSRLGHALPVSTSPPLRSRKIEYEVVYLNVAERDAGAMGWEQPPRDDDSLRTSPEGDLRRHE